MIEILHYQTSEGLIPFQKWILGFKDRSLRASILSRIDRLSLGNFGDCKTIGGGVLELRFHIGSGYRVYFGQDHQVLVILLTGGDKGTQEHDILKAQKYWKDYLRRKT